MIMKKKEERTLKITVVGLGRVGTVAAAGLAVAGHEVLGVDIDYARVTTLSMGRPFILRAGVGR